MSGADVVDAERVSLDERGRDLYLMMLMSEHRAIMSLCDIGCTAWRQRYDYKFTQYSDGETHDSQSKRRFIVLVPPHAINSVREKWPLILAELDSQRANFLSHVQRLRDMQELDIPGAGVRSTSRPVWYEPDHTANGITYSINNAFRSSVLLDSELNTYLNQRSDEIEQWIDNAKSNSQHDRVDDYMLRLEALLLELDRINELRNEHGPLMARMQSGVGTKIRFSWNDIHSTQHTLQHLALVSVSDESIRVEKAPTRNGSARYSKPITTLLNGRLWIYHASN